MINFSNVSMAFDGVPPGAGCEVIASEVVRDYSQAIDSTIIKFCIGIVFCWIIVNSYIPFLKDLVISIFGRKGRKIRNWIFRRIHSITIMVADYMLLFILGIAYYQGQFSEGQKSFIYFNLCCVAVLTIYNLLMSYLDGDFDYIKDWFRGKSNNDD